MQSSLLEEHRQHCKSKITTATSRDLPICSSSIDLVLTSPPYCTRIDYANSTKAELAVLGIAGEAYKQLRRAMLGTPTVPSTQPVQQSSWGQTCSKFLEQLYAHKSYASKGYYFKNHLQYFDALFPPLEEIVRVTKPNGRIVIVVQDSFYKEIHNDLASICEDMFACFGLACTTRWSFQPSGNRSKINKRAKVYRSTFSVTETVLQFSKEPV